MTFRRTIVYFTKRKIELSAVQSLWRPAILIMTTISPLAQRLKDNPPVKRYRIGEVAHFSGLSRQTVHNYTIMGLIRETQWTPGGHRLYHASVFDVLMRIDQLKRTMTLREIRSILDQECVNPAV